ncbi:MAG: DUF177 domain-containing protein [Propionibacteriaceae bacterium]|nr:DUF177 domain-containing protein [Propionibacteriaceae bacterium]
MSPASGIQLIATIHELPRRPGELRVWRRTVDAPPDLGIDMIGVPEDSPVDLDLTLESAGDGIWVSGTVTARLVGECARCLAPLDEQRSFPLQELYYYPGKDAEEDALFVTDEQLDLEPALRDAIVLELPFSPLCRPDCKGLCPECGANLNDDPSHTHGDAVDPRWAALAALKPADDSAA